MGYIVFDPSLASGDLKKSLEYCFYGIEWNHPAIKWYISSLSHWNWFPMGRSYIAIVLHNQTWNHSTWINKANSSNLCYIKAWFPLSTFWEGYIQPPSRPWFLTNAISLIVSHLVRLGPGASVNLVTGMGPLPCSQKIHFYAVQISSSSKLWLEETEKKICYTVNSGIEAAYLLCNNLTLESLNLSFIL